MKSQVRQKRARAKKRAKRIAAGNPKKAAMEPKANSQENAMTDEDFDFLFEHLTAEELQKIIDQAKQELAAKKR